jgi:hypothetical protein
MTSGSVAIIFIGFSFESHSFRPRDSINVSSMSCGHDDE